MTVDELERIVAENTHAIAHLERLLGVIQAHIETMTSRLEEQREVIWDMQYEKLVRQRKTMQAAEVKRKRDKEHEARMKAKYDKSVANRRKAKA